MLPAAPYTTAAAARLDLQRLMGQRLDAADVSLDANALYMSELDNEIEVSRAAYIGLAVTEIATLRAELSAPQVG
jgi:hypothetical protein